MIPEPIFELFGLFPVHMYGVCIAVGILACFLVFFGFTKYKKLHPAAQDFAFYVALGAIALGFLSAKVFQAFYNFIEDGVFDFANAGVTAMGGFVGGLALLVFYLAKRLPMRYKVGEDRIEYLPKMTEQEGDL